MLTIRWHEKNTAAFFLDGTRKTHQHASTKKKRKHAHKQKRNGFTSNEKDGNRKQQATAHETHVTSTTQAILKHGRWSLLVARCSLVE